MVMQVGFHVEGHDHLIMRGFLAKLLNVVEEDIEIDFIDARGRGWEFVLEMVPQALRRFYAKGARAALIGIDNDGDLNVGKTGQPEDPKRPRHWNHPARARRCR